MSVHYMPWTGVRKKKPHALTEIRTPKRPVCSESLRQLRFPGPCVAYEGLKKFGIATG
jgi:hypothetical protein